MCGSLHIILYKAEDIFTLHPAGAKMKPSREEQERNRKLCSIRRIQLDTFRSPNPSALRQFSPCTLFCIFQMDTQGLRLYEYEVAFSR